MPAQPPLLTLLQLTSDTVAAERVVERLRATGLAARALVTSRPDRLNDLLSRRAFDIILWWSQPNDPAMEEAMAERSKHAAEIPLIMILNDAPTSEDVARAKQFGARDLLSADAQEQLAWRIQREIADLRQRRQTRELIVRLQNCEQRAAELDGRGPVAAPDAAGIDPGDVMSIGAAGRAMLFAEIDARLGANRAVSVPFAVFFIQVRRHTGLLRDLGLTHALELFDSFGSVLSSLVEPPHLIARASDDGFVMLLDAMDETTAQSLVEHIRANARFPEYGALGNNGESDCEIGYYLIKGRAPNAEDILNAAHRLCVYRDASHSDWNGGMQTPTSLAARTKQDAVKDESNVADKIAAAIDTEQLKLVYQPVISLMGDTRENYSVFVRLLDDEGELLEAKDFIGAAIRRGLIETVDKWAIRKAVQVLSEQRQSGHKLRFFINLAEDTFRNPSIIVHICDTLRELDVRGNWLTFQFQEDLISDNLASLIKLVDAMKQIKCRVAINRFGSNERSEMILKALPVDFVVFTPSYAKGLADDPAKQQRLLELAKLARQLNVKSVVTGVEDARALTVLWTAGVDYVQGNFLQRPSPTLSIVP